jgi:phosphatidylglycerophosphatase A
MTALRSFLDFLAKELAFASGIGRIPKAPGTFGSIPGLAVGALLHTAAAAFSDQKGLRIAVISLGLLLVTMIALWAIHRTEKLLGIHDDGRIVIDEVAGQAIAVAFFTPTVFSLTLGFVLFRILDISKPGPIGWCDRHLPGAWGTLVDDILAGALAALLLGLAGSILAYF